MENPTTRPAAARLIDSVIQDHFAQQKEDALKGEFRCGLSLCMKIYNALLNAGYTHNFCNSETETN